MFTGQARNLHAEAVRKEIENHKLAVHTYFELRRENKEARAAENPGYLDRQRKLRETRDDILRTNLDTGVDFTNELNWMLSELQANGSYAEFASDGSGILSSTDNMKLSDLDQKQIRLSEGRVAGGGLVFTLDPDQILDPHWTRALQEEPLQGARKTFEDALAAAVNDLKDKHQISKQNQDRLLKAVETLTEDFEAAWPRERRKSPDHFLFEYQPAKYCLKRLETSTKRLVTSNTPVAFDDSYTFTGKTAAELVGHMMSKGLEFAPPEAGGEGVYRRLFNSVRAFYVQLVPEPIK